MRMREITSVLVGDLRKEGVGAEVILGVRNIKARFEGLLVDSVLANKRLRGRIDALKGVSGGSQVPPSPIVADPGLSANKMVSAPSTSKLSSGRHVSVSAAAPRCAFRGLYQRLLRLGFLLRR